MWWFLLGAIVGGVIIFLLFLYVFSEGMKR